MTLQLNPLFIPFIPAEVSSASSAVYHQGLFGQSAPSARSRSSEGSSDDQVPVPTHDGFIEVDLRAGGPQLCESPCQTLRPIPRTHEYYQALDGHNGYLLIGQLMNICNQEGLNYSAIDFCGRRSIYTPKRDPIVTLLIRANRPDVTQRRWADIARKLQYHLRGQGLPGISVEIMDPRLEEDAKIHSCHPNDAVVPMWTNIVYDILARVHDTTGINTIGCFRIGRDMDRLRCPPTVLVGIDRQVFRDWKVVREAIVSALNSRGLESVGVRIRKDKKPLRANNVERNPIQPSDCRPDPPLGYSLSPHNMKDAIGTLGGWVELKSPRTGQWVSFAITCTHCCLPPRGALNDEDQEVLCKWKQEGVRIGDPNAARLLSVDAPCYRDIKTGIDAKESVMDTVKTAEFYRGVEEARAQGRSSSSGDQEGWKRASDCLSELDEERNTIKSFVRNGQHVLGNVFAASGLREARSTDDPDKLSVRDWALVQPKSGRSAGDNAVQLARELPHIRHLGEFETALPQNDQGVYKIGRASGFTRGMYGNLKVCHLDTIMLENGQKVTRTAWEHAVTKSPGAFLELGDSGSLLFNVSGDVLGILFGASEKGDIAYFTATGDLLQDIRSITGALEVRMKQTQLQEELDEYISSNFGGTRKS